MFSLTTLARPLVAAPMAGGPSTPDLVVSAAQAGGLGFLAAGYKTVDAVAAEIDAVRAAGVETFGLNLFVPSTEPTPDAAVAAYRATLAPLAKRLGVEPGTPRPDDDSYDSKLALAVERRVPVVSFTFGLPDAATVSALHAADAAVWATVASLDAARAAAERGVDALVVQGCEAGGHRATLTAAEPPHERRTIDLVAQTAAVGVPLIAAGGIASRADVATALAAGARAVQLGTALLLCPEAGTSDAHRAALRDPRFTETAVTRAFTGRPARGLANAFMADHPDAPAAYPAVHQVTSPLRRAAAASGDVENLHLWAGTRWADAVAEPLADVFAHLSRSRGAASDQK